MKNKLNWDFFRSPAFILICFLTAMLFVITIGLVAIFHDKSLAAELPSATSVYGDFRYEIIEIEGMPCVVASGGNYFGITCDWSRWDSKQEARK